MWVQLQLYFLLRLFKTRRCQICVIYENLELATLSFKQKHHEVVVISWGECNYIKIYEQISLQIGSWSNPSIVHSRLSFAFFLFVISFHEGHDELYALILI